jgi:hypothetical protein
MTRQIIPVGSAKHLCFFHENSWVLLGTLGNFNVDVHVHDVDEHEMLTAFLLRLMETHYRPKKHTVSPLPLSWKPPWQVVIVMGKENMPPTIQVG